MAKLNGELDITLVINENLSPNILLASKVEIAGEYEDLHDEMGTSIASGKFTYELKEAEIFDGESDTEILASFDGQVKDRGRPLVSLKLDGIMTFFGNADLTIDYKYQSHTLKGEATFINELMEDENNFLVIELIDERGTKVNISLDDNNLGMDGKDIGKIHDNEGELLGTIQLLNGVPTIYYPNDEFESIF